ncbi:MAG: riboflavin synthase [Desulfuromonadales bacterium]|nr:riboflavin synthase [Desulfuromonadales bacterium]MDT8422337.1 riboflavin synthase [Desulfuromonadales bacterium]
MFTGLIEDLGSAVEWRKGAQRLQLVVATALPMTSFQRGESIAVNGVCLTVVEFGGGRFVADVSPETWQRTTLEQLHPGQPVNLERALQLSSRLGGHLVSGHVDGLATVVRREERANAVLFAFHFTAELNRLVVAKGSITIDGISLTVNSVGESDFTVMIIPHTLAHTALRERRVGDAVNIETDLIGKYVARLLGKDATVRNSVDLDFLARHGFV